MIININAEGYIASVTSVNGKTGAVTLTPSDIEPNFTLIETITLSEDTASIFRSGLNYTDMLFRFTMPIANTAKTWTGQYQFNGGNVAWFNVTARTGGVTKINFRIKCEGGLMFCDYGRSDAVTAQHLTVIPAERPAGWMGSFTLSKITSFNLGFFDSIIPAGTVIEIYAR